MSLKKYVDEAWSDVDSVKRYNTDTQAWQDCNSVKKYNTESQAWEDVWTGDFVAYLSEKRSIIPKSTSLQIIENTDVLNIGVLAGLGEVTLAAIEVDGDFGKTVYVDFCLSLTGTGNFYISVIHTNGEDAITDTGLQPDISEQTKNYTKTFLYDVKSVILYITTSNASMLSAKVSELKINNKKVNFKEVKQ